MGDGASDDITTYNQAEVTHTYATSGTYNVSIYGTINGFRFANGGDKLKIINILNKTIISVDKDLESFQFGKAARILYDFSGMIFAIHT